MTRPTLPVKRDQIVDELRRRILAGTLPRGARLPEDELARDFGVSSTPVRSGRPFGEGPDPFDPDVD